MWLCLKNMSKYFLALVLNCDIFENVNHIFMKDLIVPPHSQQSGQDTGQESEPVDPLHRKVREILRVSAPCKCIPYIFTHTKSVYYLHYHYI